MTAPGDVEALADLLRDSGVYMGVADPSKLAETILAALPGLGWVMKPPAHRLITAIQLKQARKNRGEAESQADAILALLEGK